MRARQGGKLIPGMSDGADGRGGMDRQSSRKGRAMPRDAEQTRKRILAAATVEFARKGLGGARVDEIALRSKSNKRMIYHYFGSKERLVHRGAGGRLSRHPQRPNRNCISTNWTRRAAIKRLVAFTWNYYLEHPEFLTLVNSENLHRAKHLKSSAIIRKASNHFVSMVNAILDRGVALGVFRDGIDPVQLNITIAAIGYYYLTNRFTGSIIFERDLMARGKSRRRGSPSTSTRSCGWSREP